MDILTVSKATEFDICPDRYGEQQLTGVTLLTPDKDYWINPMINPDQPIRTVKRNVRLLYILPKTIAQKS